MQIDIVDDPGNWLNWGKLVRSWVFGTTSMPTNTTQLQTQIDAAHVRLNNPLPSNRLVQFDHFEDPPGKLHIPLPTQKMVTDDENNLKSIATKPQGQRHYPLPSFYAIAFGGAQEVDLAINELLDFGTRRLGEYTIQECQ
jgi:hypothetical protein